MRLINTWTFILILLISAVPALAATLHGSIYDIELNELKGVVVEIDSEPIQRQVAKEGTYSFELNPGHYVLTANYTDGFYAYSVEEQISIVEDGDYTYDLFIFPDLTVDDEDLSDTADIEELSGDVFDEYKVDWNIILILFVIAALVLFVTAYFVVGHRKRREEVQEIEEVEKLESTIKGEAPQEKPKKISVEPDQFINDVLEVIRSEGGRTTQKEIRKHIPLSEAKISLIISELEHKKIVHKVKKGRGNIIILNKN